MRAFAAADGLEAKAEFRFPARGKKGPQIDELKPACLVNTRGGKKLDSRAKTFSGLSAAREKGVTFEGVTVVVGEGSQAAQAMILFEAPADYIEAVLTALLARFEPTAAGDDGLQAGALRLRVRPAAFRRGVGPGHRAGRGRAVTSEAVPRTDKGQDR